MAPSAIEPHNPPRTPSARSPTRCTASWGTRPVRVRRTGGGAGRRRRGRCRERASVVALPELDLHAAQATTDDRPGRANSATLRGTRAPRGTWPAPRTPSLEGVSSGNAFADHPAGGTGHGGTRSGVVAGRCSGNAGGALLQERRDALRGVGVRPEDGDRRGSRARAPPTARRPRASTTSAGGSAATETAEVFSATSRASARRVEQRRRRAPPGTRAAPRSASGASKTRPVIAHSIACEMPTSRGRNQLDAASGTIPRRANTKPNRADGRGEAHVHGQRHRGADADAAPLIAPITGLRAGGEAQRDHAAAVARSHPDPTSPSGVRPRRARRSSKVPPPAAEVGARAERPPRAGDDQRADRVVGVGRVERRDRSRRPSRAVNAFIRVRPVQGRAWRRRRSTT